MKHTLSQALTGRLPHLAFADLVQGERVSIILPPAGGVVEVVKEAGARDVLVLTPAGPKDYQRHPDHVAGRYLKLRTVHESNCRTAILHGRSVLALMSRKAHAAIKRFLVPKALALTLAAPAILRHARRGRLAITGETSIALGGKTRSYIVVESPMPAVDNRRQYGTAGLTPLELMRRLDGLDYVVLRWAELIESGAHEGDIDILLSAADAPRVAERFADKVGTYPLDVYSDDGSGGFYFNRAPYIVPVMARQMIETAVTTPKGLRIPTPYWRYLSFGYHLLFHIKSRRVPPGTVAIGPDTFTSPKYFAELCRLAEAAGLEKPTGFDSIETEMKRADVFPGIDLIGFYSEKNPFLKHRYFDASTRRPGLMTVFVRDFGKGMEPVDGIRGILSETFEILADGAVTDARRAAIVKGVRGGNWSDPEAEGGQAPPVYWFVCWDHHPVAPNARSRKKRPRVDNEHVNLKYGIREALGEKVRKQQRLIHTSDNTAEALEHLEVIGALDPAVLARIRSLV